MTDQKHTKIRLQGTHLYTSLFSTPTPLLFLLALLVCIWPSKHWHYLSVPWTASYASSKAFIWIYSSLHIKWKTKYYCFTSVTSTSWQLSVRLLKTRKLQVWSLRTYRANVQLTETSASAKYHWHFSSSTPRPWALSCLTAVTAFTKRLDQSHRPDFPDCPAVTVQDLLFAKPRRALNWLSIGVSVVCFKPHSFSSVSYTAWSTVAPHAGESMAAAAVRTVPSGRSLYLHWAN